MLILFDIDHTLLDTEKLRNKIQNKRLPALFGITNQELVPITKEYLATLGSSIEFSPRAYCKFLADKLGKSKEKEAIDIFLNNPTDFYNSLFPDVIPTLQELYQKHHLGIFSEGEPEFQRAKLKQSGVLKFLKPELIFVFPFKGDKLNFVWNKVKNYQDSSFIVDDSPEHVVSIAKTNFIPILMQRDKKREKGHFSIQNLSELPTVLQNI